MLVVNLPMEPLSFYPAPADALSDKRCNICLEDLPNGKEIFRHTGVGGDLHQFCKGCIKTAVKTCGVACPVCRLPVDTQSLFSLKERVWSDLKEYALPCLSVVIKPIVVLGTSIFFGASTWSGLSAIGNIFLPQGLAYGLAVSGAALTTVASVIITSHYAYRD